MDLLVDLFLFTLIFAILYWMITLVVSRLPKPIADTARVVFLCVLGLIAISALLGEIGYMPHVGLPHHRW